MSVLEFDNGRIFSWHLYKVRNFIIRVTLYVFYIEFCNVIQCHSSQLLLGGGYINPTDVSPLTWSLAVQRTLAGA